MRKTTLPLRLAWLAAALWLLFGMPVSGLWRATDQDFPQFYLAGKVARAGTWDDLYPIPLSASRNNPGAPDDSLMRPAYAQAAREAGQSSPCRFIQPPPNALWCWPLAFLPYRTANILWLFLSGAAALLLIRQTILLYRAAGGASLRGELLLILFLAFSPSTYRAIRVGNVSLFVACTCGAVLLSLVRPRPLAGGACLFWGALAKYAPAVLVPLLVARRRWRELLLAAGLGAAAVLLAWIVMGTAPFTTFARDIAPTLGRPILHRGNQSLTGFAARMSGGEVAPWLAHMLTATRALTGILLIGATLLLRQRLERPLPCLAAGGALLAWLLAMSPIAWEHYCVYLFPVWGVLCAAPGRVTRWFAFIAMLLAWYPLNLNLTFRAHAPELLASHLLWSYLLAMLLCVHLAFGRSPSNPEPLYRCS